MKWDIKRSGEIKKTITENEKLIRELSEATDKVLKKHSIELKGMSYVFEPRVFTMDPAEAPEIMMRSRQAMVTAIMDDLIKKGSEANMDIVLDSSKFMKCLPECGGMDPITLKVLERSRISEWIDDAPTPVSITSADLMKRIVGNKALLRELSAAIFGILEQNGISFKGNEGCVFTPVVFETPLYAQKVAAADELKQIRGFGPQVYADPTPEPAVGLRLKPFPGIIDTPWGPTVGIIIHCWWWIGIPAPEILHALDVMKKIQ